MKWSYRIAVVAGIEVRIHLTFLMLLAFYAWTYYGVGGLPLAVSGVTFTLLLFLCVLLHEFGHAFAARRYGIRTPDITLLPFGGVARLERMPTLPIQELVIALAGPAVNVAIAAGLCLAMGRVPRMGEFTIFGDPEASLPLQLFFVNIILIAFNLIPAFPMDGGRVLRALLAMRFPHAKATLIAARVGQGVAVLFGAASFTPWGGPMLIFIAGFVFLGAQQELVHARMKEAFGALTAGDVMLTQFATIPENLRSDDVPSLLLGSAGPLVPAVDGRMHLRGFADAEELRRSAQALPPGTPLHPGVRRLPFVHPKTALGEALKILQDAPAPLIPVLNASGQIVGLLSLEHLAQMPLPQSRK
ncbi:MAG TPA: site-2 protease family protein [Terrimicrobiaceae bacterium]|nr:site-2 protease family protein [Terrimicrobiaceae bacterium]